MSEIPLNIEELSKKHPEIMTTNPAAGTETTPPSGTTAPPENQALTPIQDAAGTNETPSTIAEGNTAAPPGETAPPEAGATDQPPGETAPPEAGAADQPPEEHDDDHEPGETENQGGTAQDEVNTELLETMERVSGAEGGKAAKEEGKGEDPYFDKLPVKWKESSSRPIETNAQAQETKAKIGKLRESGLYQAVVVARLLKENKSNPIATGIFSRVINSSKWNNLADLNSGAAGLTGMLSTFDKSSKGQSVYQGISLVTNMISVVTSLRNIYLKVKGLKFQASADAWIKNLILGVGIIGDFSLALAKSVAIAKTIASFAKKDLPILKKVSNWMFLATGTSQAIALMTTSQALVKGLSDINKTKMKKAEVWEKAKLAVRSTLGRGRGAQLALQAEGTGAEDGEQEADAGAAGEQENNAGPQEANAGAEHTAGRENGEQAAAAEAAGPTDEKMAKKAEKNRKKELKKKDSRKEETRLIKAKKALQVLEQQDGEGEHLPGREMSEENKDALITYIGLSKRIKKQEHDEAALVASGINVVFGLGSSILTGGKFVTGEGAKRSGKSGWKTANEAFTYGATGAGVLANGVTMASSAGRFISRVSNRKDDRSETVKARLFQKIDTLSQDEHGLKYLEESLESSYAGENREANMDGEAVQAKALETENLYHDAGGMLEAMGTPVAKLSGAKNLEEFKKILVSGLV